MTSAAPAILSSRSSIALTYCTLHSSSFLFQSAARHLSPSRSALRFRTSASLEVCVKQSITSPGRLGDCPFSQRVLLTLEEKNLPYYLKLIDVTNKPDWFLAINPEGKVPIIKFENKWISDSDVITQALEEKYPEHPLATPPEKSSVGSRIFSSFIGFLVSNDPNDGKEEALITELAAFDDYIKEHGPFVNGNVISAVDLSLGPKLYHMEIALGHYKEWSLPDSLIHVRIYMKTIFSRDSFIKTRALPEDVIAGWRPKVYARVDLNSAQKQTWQFRRCMFCYNAACIQEFLSMV